MASEPEPSIQLSIPRGILNQLSRNGLVRRKTGQRDSQLPEHFTEPSYEEYLSQVLPYSEAGFSVVLVRDQILQRILLSFVAKTKTSLNLKLAKHLPNYHTVPRKSTETHKVLNT